MKHIQSWCCNDMASNANTPGVKNRFPLERRRAPPGDCSPDSQPEYRRLTSTKTSPIVSHYSFPESIADTGKPQQGMNCRRNLQGSIWNIGAFHWPQAVFGTKHLHPPECSKCSHRVVFHEVGWNVNCIVRRTV